MTPSITGRRLAAATLGVALIAATPALLHAQDFNGSFATTGTGGNVVLTLRGAPGGQLTGTFAGNGSTFEVLAVQDPEAHATIAGTITGQGFGLYFEAAFRGEQLVLVLVEPDAAGDPDYATARELVLTRQAAVAAGTGGGYPANAPRLPGAAAAPPSPATGALAPSAGPAGAASPGAAGHAAADPLTRLLTSSAWCSFSYSGGSTSGGSYGASSTSRFEFRPDGIVLITTGGESSSSNPYGGVGSQSSGGQQLYWKVQQGMLHLSQDGVTFQPIQVRVENNSAGYPIITAADGTEYMSCN